MRGWLWWALAACGDAPGDVPSVAPVPANPNDVGPLPPPLDEVGCRATDHPLRFSCGITLRSADSLQLTWRRQDGRGPARTRTREPSDVHVVNVDLLEFDTTYVVTAASPTRRWTTEFETLSPPFEGLETSLEITGTSTMGLIGTELPCSNRAVAVVYDTDTGGLVWYQNLDESGHLGVFDMVRFTDRGTVVGETRGSVVEVDRQGRDIARFDVDYPDGLGLHHEIVDWNGLYLSPAQRNVDEAGAAPITLDDVVALDASGNEVFVWRADEHLSIPTDAEGDVLHTNGLAVDEGGNLYQTWRARDAIARFDGPPPWGAPRWVMTGDGQAGWVGNDVAVDWGTVTPPHFGAPHSLHLRRDGRLMLLDNENGRGLVFTVDDQSRTATVDAAYPTREASCRYQGTAVDTRAGNAVVACASRWVREFDGESAELLWEARISRCVDEGVGGWSPGQAVRWYPLDHWE